MCPPLSSRDGVSPVDALDKLSERQRTCLALVAAGLSSSAIGRRLGISGRTVDEHVMLACQVLGVRTRLQAAARLAAAVRRTPDRPRLLP